MRKLQLLRVWKAISAYFAAAVRQLRKGSGREALEACSVVVDGLAKVEHVVESDVPQLQCQNGSRADRLNERSDRQMEYSVVPRVCANEQPMLPIHCSKPYARRGEVCGLITHAEGICHSEPGEEKTY